MRTLNLLTALLGLAFASSFMPNLFNIRKPTQMVSEEKLNCQASGVESKQACERLPKIDDDINPARKCGFCMGECGVEWNYG